MKSSYAPLVPTFPFAVALREKFLAKMLKSACKGVMSRSCSSSSTESATSDEKTRLAMLMMLQRRARASLINNYLKSALPTDIKAQKSAVGIHPIETLGIDNYLQSEKYHMVPYYLFARTKKQSVRDVKAFEKSDRKRKGESDDKKKRRMNEFHKVLIGHRDDLLRFHKARKAGGRLDNTMP